MTDAVRPAPSTLKKLGWASAATIFALLFVEGCASIVVAFRDLTPPAADGFAGESKNCEYDADLGWALAPNLAVDPYRRPGTTFTTDSRGFRGVVETTTEVPEGSFRVVCIGDSFTLGFGVGDHETFPHHLGALGPGIDVVNMGVSGYGVDQIYLSYLKRGAEIDANLLLYCVIEDDFRRMMFDRFGDNYSKPWLELIDGELAIRNVPVPEVGRSSRGASRLREFVGRLGVGRLIPKRSLEERWSASEAVAEFLFSDLAARCRARDMGFALVLLPTHEEVTKGFAPKSRWLADVAREAEFHFLDLTPDLVRLEPDQVPLHFRLRAGDRHYTGRGNKLVARTLLERLSSFELLPRDDRDG